MDCYDDDDANLHYHEGPRSRRQRSFAEILFKAGGVWHRGVGHVVYNCEAAVTDRLHHSLMKDISRSIKEQLDYKIEGPTTFNEDERLSASKYRRAKVDHLYLNDSLDPDLLEMIYENHDNENDGWREVASDISDDEGGPETGRISPCTFARWAEGSKRWDDPGDKYDSIWEARKEYEIPVRDHCRPFPLQFGSVDH